MLRPWSSTPQITLGMLYSDHRTVGPNIPVVAFEYATSAADAAAPQDTTDRSGIIVSKHNITIDTSTV